MQELFICILLLIPNHTWLSQHIKPVIYHQIRSPCINLLCFILLVQSITKNRTRWSNHTLDDNVQMVRCRTQTKTTITCLKLLITNQCLKPKNICLSQPTLTDEQGWKRFCLGEKTFLGPSSSSPADEGQEPALDYRKVVKPLPCL